MRVLSDDVDLAVFAIKAATAACEEYTGRVFVQQIYKAVLAAWPQTGWNNGINRPQPQFRKMAGIDLPLSPLVAINSVKYWPSDGGAQIEWDPANYAADLISVPGRLIVANGVDLPSVAERYDAIEIEFEAGHATTEEGQPSNYLMCMLQLARHFYDNPGVVDPDGKVKNMPFSFRFLLRSLRVN